ncbi:MAG: type VI secretion system protein TssA [Rhodocyclaceae bacterium]|nr:type VI secretion system protein TssA [Rhodocyclaceae bacterium]
MAIIDLEKCLEPLEGDSPTGEDLEYDQEFVDLELASQGTPDRVDRVKDPDDPYREIDRVVPGREPDYRAVMDAGISLFKRTKDLRVAMHLVSAATRLQGLPGLAEGTDLVASLLERYWDEVHPRLSPDDDYDPVMRVNILGSYVDPDRVMRAFKSAPLVEVRAMGRFTVRDIDVAYGDAAPLEGQTTATKELLAATCAQADPEEIAQRAAGVSAALAGLAKIYAIFREKSSSYPEFTQLKKTLERIAALYAQSGAGQAAGAEAPAEGEGGDGGAVVSGGMSVAAAVPGRISSRADAKRLLENVCDYLENAEPAHPAPLLIRRAVRLLDMNFLDIMKELTPDVVSQIESLGGLNRE